MPKIRITAEVLRIAAHLRVGEKCEVGKAEGKDGYAVERLVVNHEEVVDFDLDAIRPS